MKLEERRQMRLKRQLYYVALGSFILVLIWIGFEIFWAYQRTDEVIVDQPNLSPIEPELYTDLARNFEDRRVFTEEEIVRYLKAIRESGTLGQEESSSLEVSTSSATFTEDLTAVPEETTFSSQINTDEVLPN